MGCCGCGERTRGERFTEQFPNAVLVALICGASEFRLALIEAVNHVGTESGADRSLQKRQSEFPDRADRSANSAEQQHVLRAGQFANASQNSATDAARFTLRFRQERFRAHNRRCHGFREAAWTGKTPQQRFSAAHSAHYGFPRHPKQSRPRQR
jgi:hypothetical protein